MCAQVSLFFVFVVCEEITLTLVYSLIANGLQFCFALRDRYQDRASLMVIKSPFV